MELNLETIKEGTTFLFANAKFVVGVALGATGLLAYQRKYKPVTPDDVNIAKEMSRLTTELQNSTKAHKECIEQLSPFQAIADEYIKEKLKK